MSTARKDGGPAHAGLKATRVETLGGRYDATHVAEYEPAGGISVRDYFAAKAMQSIVAHRECVGREFGFESPPTMSERAYEIADAMLQARSQ